jgi:hypothetical protein
MEDVIPDEVLREIKVYLHKQIARAERGWHAGEEDEDTLTGDFGGSLRTDGWITTGANGGSWAWQISYKKFRGGGPNAPEKSLGADGVFQIEVRVNDTSILVFKAILFQAKKDRSSSRGNLLKQVRDMEQIAPGGSAVFEFGPNGYRAASGDEILIMSERNPQRIPHPNQPLDSFLADRFLPCESGLRGMFYDAERQNLIVPQKDGTIRIVNIRIPNVIELEVTKRD